MPYEVNAMWLQAESPTGAEAMSGARPNLGQETMQQLRDRISRAGDILANGGNVTKKRRMDRGPAGSAVARASSPCVPQNNSLPHADSDSGGEPSPPASIFLAYNAVFRHTAATVLPEALSRARTAAAASSGIGAGSSSIPSATANPAAVAGAAAAEHSCPASGLGSSPSAAAPAESGRIIVRFKRPSPTPPLSCVG